MAWGSSALWRAAQKPKPRRRATSGASPDSHLRQRHPGTARKLDRQKREIENRRREAQRRDALAIRRRLYAQTGQRPENLPGIVRRGIVRASQAEARGDGRAARRHIDLAQSRLAAKRDRNRRRDTIQGSVRGGASPDSVLGRSRQISRQDYVARREMPAVRRAREQRAVQRITRGISQGRSADPASLGGNLERAVLRAARAHVQGHPGKRDRHLAQAVRREAAPRGFDPIKSGSDAANILSWAPLPGLGAMRAARAGAGVLRAAAGAGKGAKATRSVRGAASGAKQARGAPRPRPPRRVRNTRRAAAAALPLATEQGRDIAKAPVNLARASAAVGPEKLAVSTLRGLRDTLAGIPQGAYMAVTDPEKLVSETVKDYKKRYGALLANDQKAIRKMLRDEGGLTPFALDAVGAAGGASVVGGSLARRGALGARAKRHMTAPRPNLRTSTNTAREQRLSRGLIGASVQRRADTKRRQEYKAEQRIRKAAKVDKGKNIPGRGIRPEKGEVVYRREGLGALADRRRQDLALRKGEIARPKSQSILRQQREQGDVADQEGAVLAGGRGEIYEHAVTQAARSVMPVDAKRAVTALRERNNRIAPTSKKGFARKTEFSQNQRLIKAIESGKIDFDRLRGDAVRARKRGTQIDKRTPRVSTRTEGGSSPAQVRRYDPAVQTLVDEGQLPDFDSHPAVREVKDAGGERPAQMKAYIDSVGLRRVIDTIHRTGRERPTYVLSRERGASRAGDRTVGRKPMPADKTYSGTLFREGREDLSGALFEGQRRSIKAHHNLNLLSDIAERNMLDLGKPSHATAGELIRELGQKGYDPDEFTLLDRSVLDARGEIARRMADQDKRGTDAEAGVGTMDDLLKAARGDQEARQRLAITDPSDVRRGRWIAVPKGVGDELNAVSTASNVGGRLWGKGKGQTSRILLGAGNFPWLGYQVLSNKALGYAAGVKPFTRREFREWRDSLSPREREAFEDSVGVSHHVFDTRRTHMGSVGEGSKVIGAMRAFQTTPLYRKATRRNPIDKMFEWDARQTSHYRGMAIYSKMKKDAKLNASTSRVIDSQKAMSGAVAKASKGDVDAAMKSILRDRDAMVRHAQAVDDFMGDYMTYTAFERKWAQNGVMFYGFLRHSLKLVFWTMPVKHPAVTGLVAKMGQMGHDELERLFGDDPIYALGNIAIGGKKGVELPLLGNVGSIPLKRAHPALNALTEGIFGNENLTNSFLRAATSLPPMLTIPLIQGVFGTAPYTGTSVRVKGEASGTARFGRERQDLTGGERVDVIKAGFLRLIPIERQLRAALHPEPQSDDSHLGHIVRTNIKDKEISARVRSDTEKAKERNVWLRIFSEFAPAIPEPYPLAREKAGQGARKSQRERVAEYRRNRARKGPKKKSSGSGVSLIGGGDGSSNSGGQSGGSGINLIGG